MPPIAPWNTQFSIATDKIAVKSAQTTSCYIIKKHFVKILLDNFKYAKMQLVNKKPYSTFAIDQYWKKLFLKYNIYTFSKVFIYQLAGYSDIEGKQVNYNYNLEAPMI